MPNLGENLIDAVSERDFSAVQSLVLNMNAPIDYSNESWTPLIKAVNNGYTEIVEFLIENGANPNAQSGDNWTPLYAAVTKKNHELLKYLLENDANPRAGGLNVMEKARSENDSASIRILKQQKQWATPQPNIIRYFSDDTGFPVTRIFNFNAMTVMTVVENQQETAIHHDEKHFSDPTVDIDLLYRAKEELLKSKHAHKIDENLFTQSLQRPVREKRRHRISKRSNNGAA